MVGKSVKGDRSVDIGGGGSTKEREREREKWDDLGGGI